MRIQAASVRDAALAAVPAALADLGALVRIPSIAFPGFDRAEVERSAAAVKELHETAADYAIGTSTGAVVSAAERRGIPSLRITDEANLFQLGWGSRQKRLQATITGATNSIAVGIASDKQLTKTLLEQAGCPVLAGATVTSLPRRTAGPQKLSNGLFVH